MSLTVTIVSIAACAAAAGVTSFLMLESRDARHFAAAKAEELYTHIEAFDQSLTGYINKAGQRLSDGYRLPDADWSELTQASAKARMLISFYFPALWPQVKQADGAVARCLAALRACQNAGRSGESFQELDGALSDLRAAMDTLKHAVVTTHRDGHAKRLRRRLLAPAGPVTAAA